MTDKRLVPCGFKKIFSNVHSYLAQIRRFLMSGLFESKARSNMKQLIQKDPCHLLDHSKVPVRVE